MAIIISFILFSDVSGYKEIMPKSLKIESNFPSSEPGTLKLLGVSFSSKISFISG